MQIGTLGHFAGFSSSSVTLESEVDVVDIEF